MDKIGEKSFNPSEFSVYKSAIDFSKVNVWEVFKRRFPCQIALICHDSAKTIRTFTDKCMLGSAAIFVIWIVIYYIQYAYAVIIA